MLFISGPSDQDVIQINYTILDPFATAIIIAVAKGSRIASSYRLGVVHSHKMQKISGITCPYMCTVMKYVA